MKSINFRIVPQTKKEMIIRIKEKKHSHTRTLIILTIGWIAAYPLIKFGAQARIENPLNEPLFNVSYVIIVLICTLYSMLKYEIKSIEFSDDNNHMMMLQKNWMGNSKTIERAFADLNFSCHNIATKREEIRIHQKHTSDLLIIKNRFAPQDYEAIKEKLSEIVSLRLD